MNFTKDLSFGKTWEVLASKLVGGVVEFAPDGKFKPYDFIADGVKYEVKADRLAHKYGANTMFVEYECNCQPSGVSTTEADVWMYFMVYPSGGFKCYSIPVSDLKEWCKGCRTKAGGDGYRSLGYIVPVKTAPLVEVLGGQEPARDLHIRLPPPPPLSPHAQRTQGSRTELPSPQALVLPE